MIDKNLTNYMGIKTGKPVKGLNKNWSTKHILLFKLLLISVICNLLTLMFFIGNRIYHSDFV